MKVFITLMTLQALWSAIHLSVYATNLHVVLMSNVLVLPVLQYVAIWIYKNSTKTWKLNFLL